ARGLTRSASDSDVRSSLFRFLDDRDRPRTLCCDVERALVEGLMSPCELPPSEFKAVLDRAIHCALRDGGRAAIERALLETRNPVVTEVLAALASDTDERKSLFGIDMLASGIRTNESEGTEEVRELLKRTVQQASIRKAMKAIQAFRSIAWIR